MRLFTASEVDSRLVSRLQQCIDDLRRRAATAPGARITWVSADHLHITVRFIGEVDETRAAAVASTLESPVGIAPFDVTVRGVGTFPPRGAPRVIWAGIEHGGEPLRQVADEISGRLEHVGFGRDDRPYRPHITLARVRDATGLRSQILQIGRAHV